MKYNNQCKLCKSGEDLKHVDNYQGDQVSICEACIDTPAYLERIEYKTQCLCGHWFDEHTLRAHIGKGECSPISNYFKRSFQERMADLDRKLQEIDQGIHDLEQKSKALYGH